MRIKDLFVDAVMLEGGPHVTKVSIVEQLLSRFVAKGFVAEADVLSIRDTVLSREQLGSTGIGQGVAIPHARHSSIQRPIGLIAVCTKPVGFDSLDGEPVNIVALLLTPREPSTLVSREYSKLSHAFLRQLCDGSFRERLSQANSDVEIRVLIEALDAE